jgi:hypothetical protein
VVGAVLNLLSTDSVPKKRPFYLISLFQSFECDEDGCINLISCTVVQGKTDFSLLSASSHDYEERSDFCVT